MKKCLNQSIPMEQATAAEQQPSNSLATGKQHSSNGQEQASNSPATAQEQPQNM
jgi:hypothetical protein